VTSTTEKIQLHTLLGSYPNAMALKSGAVTSGFIDFDFADVKVSNTAFKPLVREAKFDVGELAIVTFLQAKVYGKPYVLIPATVLGRGQHHTIAYNPQRGPLSASDLTGKRVGVRAYTQTTGAWVRGFLADDYGVDPARIQWVTFEEPHVPEYKDTTHRAPEGQKIVPMLLDGELDAVLGESSDDPRIKSLFGDPQAEAQRWYAKHKVVPINHLVVMRAHDVAADPDSAREVYRLLREGKRLAGPASSPDPVPFGIEANRPSLALIAEYAFQQRLLPRRVSVDDMFAETLDLVSDQRAHGRTASIA